MYKKTIEYVDYDGNERKEDFYFNLTKAELVDLQYSESGGLDKRISDIVNTKKEAEVISVFKDIIKRSYGVKSPDGRRFMKSPEIFKDFSETEAYSLLYMELATNDKSAEEFVNSVIPKDLKNADNTTNTRV